jgi:hypothetical protein
VVTTTNITKECKNKKVIGIEDLSGPVDVDATPKGYHLYQLSNGSADQMFLKLYEDDTFDIIRQTFHGYDGETPVVKSPVIAAGEVVEEYEFGNTDIIIGHTLSGRTVIVEIVTNDDKTKSYTLRTFGVGPTSE